jgi:hypothetical protein
MKGNRRKNMFGKTMTFAFFLALSFCCLVVAHGFVFAQEQKKRNRCRQDHFGQFADWSTPVNLGPIVNSEYNDQHPAISADGSSLYITSDRPGGFGDFDIYVSHRASVNDDWDLPQNLGSIINTQFNDSVPTFSADGHRMYFCSSRPGSLTLNGSIWVSFRDDPDDDFAWQPPTILGSEVNTGSGTCGPTLFEDQETKTTILYFTRCVGAHCSFGDPSQKFDIYASVMNEDGTFQPSMPVAELNTGFRDTRTAIRSDGLELFLTSSRPGGFGAIDLWVSTRLSTVARWGVPVNLGPTVNTRFNDGAPALSCDATTLYFYSNRPGGFGQNDLYKTTRTELCNEQDKNKEHRGGPHVCKNE